MRLPSSNAIRERHLRSYECFCIELWSATFAKILSDDQRNQKDGSWQPFSSGRCRLFHFPSTLHQRTTR